MTRRYKKMTTQTETPHAAEAPRAIWPGPKVDYNPGHCPNCGSARNRITSNQGCERVFGRGSVTRIHECCNCKTRFRSVQVIPPKDVPFFRPHNGDDEGYDDEGAEAETAQ